MNDRPVVSNRWEEAKSLFEAALLLDEQEWPAFLASHCSQDAELAAEVQQLLIADRDSSQFLAVPLLKTQDLLNALPIRIGLQLHQVLCERFEVLAYLGEGGMGQVYEALDRELNQRIAIKAIRKEIADIPGVLSRFKREVYTTRKVTHPNVCRTFDLECHTDHNGAESKITFLTMELLRGETLAQRIRRNGPLRLEQVSELAVEVAHALRAAHNAGIIHCDLKPSNIFLTGSEVNLRAVVTDFGIAKIIQTDDETPLSLCSREGTRSALALGTPAYMAPEQFERGQCTPGSDLYAFGLVIYEALTGEKPFPLSRSPQELRSKIYSALGDLKGQDIPWDLVLSSCLQADPDQRFTQVQEVLALLEGTSVPSSDAIRLAARDSGTTTRSAVAGRFASFFSMRGVRFGAVTLSLGLVIILALHYKPSFSDRIEPTVSSVAVLPFANPNGDPDLNILADNIAVNLTNDLAKMSGLKVPSQAVVTNLGKHPDLMTLRHQLEVDTVVDGSVVKSEEGLLVRVALIDARTGAQRWGQSYMGNVASMASVQRDISQEIAFRLRLDPDSSTRISHHQTTTVQAAQEAFLKGKDSLAENTSVSFERAVEDFQQAIDADPQYAPAFAQLALSYLLMANYYNRPETALDLRNKAESAARRALELDGASPEAYTAIAEVQVIRDYDWGAAERNFSRAIQLDPGYITAHVAYALFLLTPRGRFAEARTQFAYADRVVPRTVGTDVREALSEYYARRYGQSAQRAEMLWNRHPDVEVLAEILSEDYLAMNQPAKAITLLSSADLKSPDARVSRDAMLGIAFARLRQKRKARSILRQIEETKRPNFDFYFHLAALSAALGDKTKALIYLEKSYNARQTSILFVGVDALMDSLRPDIRFQHMLARLNLTNNLKGDN
jgi:eukaryotic-like serine/threonine-protein kinase